MNVLTMAAGLGYRLEGLTFSPITGGEGNIEFLAHWKLLPEAETASGEAQPEAADAPLSPDDNFAALADDVIKEANATFTANTNGNSSKKR
ncbi:hypothetical protein D3C80_1592880 [compost metagenome]